MKVTIPVLFCRNGAVATGWFSRSSDGKAESSHDVAVDCLDDAAYKSGYVVVHVEAEIDEAELLKRFTVTGKAIATGETGGGHE